MTSRLARGVQAGDRSKVRRLVRWVVRFERGGGRTVPTLEIENQEFGARSTKGVRHFFSRSRGHKSKKRRRTKESEDAHEECIISQFASARRRRTSVWSLTFFMFGVLRSAGK